MTFLKKIDEFFEKINITIGSILVIAMVVVVVLQVYYRYVLHNSLSWSEELARCIFAWVTFLGADIALRKGAHIGLDLIEKKLNNGQKTVLKYIKNFIIGFFSAAMIKTGIEVVSITMSQNLPALQIPTGYVYVAIPFAGMTMLLHVVYDTFKEIKGVA
ncbi:TRAP transporter small permease [Thermoanaerobacterium sp. DL9XJH110]|uniref:TRAP transporter small permease n=1 Tax=Thermoanaerobacterium sp. DL9XJH110 TaxID=3386643 RepID=UPI003BB4AA59